MPCGSLVDGTGAQCAPRQSLLSRWLNNAANELAGLPGLLRVYREDNAARCRGNWLLRTPMAPWEAVGGAEARDTFAPDDLAGADVNNRVRGVENHRHHTNAGTSDNGAYTAGANV